ncbi:MAG TPA: hypothetical protein VGC96_04600 [Candidatus Elarobacter sp.]|jgi:hypothetical protein
MTFLRAARFAAAALAVAGLLPATANAQGNTGMIYGHVFLSGTRIPVCPLTLWARSDREALLKAPTRSDGSFRFLLVSPGPVTVIAGRNRASVNVSVSPNLETRTGDLFVPRLRVLSRVTTARNALALRQCPGAAYRGYAYSDWEP